MLKKFRLLTRPTLARQDAPYPNKTAGERSFSTLLMGGWDDPNCAHRSHPPTHWHAVTCHLPRRGPSGFPHFAHGGAARLSFTARIGRALLYRARSASTKDGLAAPPPVLLKPRVARARGSSQPPRPLFQHPVKASQLGRSRAETRVRRLSAHSALCSHRSTRQTTRFAPDRESAWLRSLALHSPRVCA